MVLYCASALGATAQLGALSCDFLSPDQPALVVNKLTRIEVSLLDDETDTLTVALEIPLWSTIAAISSVKLPANPTASILVLTTCLHLFALTYSPTAPHIVTSSTVSILEQHGRLAEFQTISVDPLLRCIAVHAYNGLLRIVPLAPPPKGRRASKAAAAEPAVQLDLSRSYSIRLPNQNVTSLSFLPTSADSPPTFACLSADHLGHRVLDTYEVDLTEKELVPGPIDTTILQDPGSEVLIPVGNETGAEGVLVVGEESVRWVPLVSAEGSSKGKGKAGGPAQVGCHLPVGMVKAWTAVQGSPDAFLLGDIYGRLQLLQIVRAHTGKVSDLKIKDLGDTSSPTSIVFVSPSLIYISSRFADSQLIKLPSALVDESMTIESEADDLQLVAGFASLAPIMDCCLVSADGGGTSHVVTCSGAYKGGSLRIVRQGVGLGELASLEIEGIRQVWALKYQDQDLLALGFVSETKVVSFASSSSPEDEEDAQGGDIEEVDLPAFDTDKPTLLAANLGSLLLQVTASGVTFTDSASGDGELGGSWATEEGKTITLAAAAGDFLVLAVEGGLVVLLQEEAGRLVQKGSTQLPNEVACLDVSTVASQPVASIGLWTSQTVVLASLPTFTPLATQIIDTSYLLRSVLLTTFADGVTHLFAGMGDGSVASYVVDTPTWTVVQSSKKLLALGTTPIALRTFVAKGSVNVFVASDRPTIISRAGDRLIYSSVNLKTINSVTPFDSAAYPSSLALASPSGLRIGRIEGIHRVDIRTIPFEDDGPQRIAYDASTGTYGVVCLGRDINRRTGEQTTRGSIKILDATSFEVLSDLPLLEEEEGQSICVLTVGEHKCYAIGTAFVRPSETEPSSGRLLLVGASGADRAFHIIGTLDVRGCPFALVEPSPGQLVVALNSQVVAYTIDEHYILTSIATWSGAFIALCLAACGNNTLLVGDAMRSVTLLHLSPSVPYVLEEVARDYRALYLAAIAPLGGGEDFVCAEADLNLFTVQKENVTTARSMSDEFALSPRGAFHLGELVAKFCPGSFVPQYGDSGSIAAGSQLVYATSAGSLGTIVELDPTASKALTELERNLRQVIPSVGGLSHEDWRSFKSERTTRPPAGFVDGNFVQLFAGLGREDVARVLKGSSEHEVLGTTEVELLRLVEELGRLH